MIEIKKAYQSLVKVLKFKCLRCGKCEHHIINPDPERKTIIPLFPQEVERLEKEGKMYGVVSYKRLYGFSGYLKLNKKDNKCAFLTKDNKCEIHDYKPLICLIHPFQVFTVGFVFGGGMIFDTKCAWVKKHRKKLDNPSKEVREAYNYFYGLVMKYKLKYLRPQ